MVISLFQREASLLIPGRTVLPVAASGALGAGLLVGVPALHTWLGGDGAKPALPPALDVRFIQGQRSLKRCSSRDFQQEVFVPTTTTAFHGEARAVGMLLQE